MLITWQPFHQPVEENLQHPPNTSAPEKKIRKIISWSSVKVSGKRI